MVLVQQDVVGSGGVNEDHGGSDDGSRISSFNCRRKPKILTSAVRSQRQRTEVDLPSVHPSSGEEAEGARGSHVPQWVE